MSAVEFRIREFGNGNSSTAVALVAGFDGKIVDFEQTARDLVGRGNDVIAYDYEPDALISGDPELLPAMIGDISNDFLGRTSEYARRRYAGASMGAGVCFNMQRADEKALPGIYGGAGCDTAHLVMSNLLFRGLVRAFHHGIDPKKEFELKGYGEADLWEIWKDLHVPPPSGFAVALGGMDFIVRTREVMPKIETWKTDINIQVHLLRRLGHTGVIKWFADNAPFMLDLADQPLPQ